MSLTSQPLVTEPPRAGKKTAHFGSIWETVPIHVGPDGLTGKGYEPTDYAPPKKAAEVTDMAIVFAYMMPAFDHFLQLRDGMAELALQNDRPPPLIHSEYAIAIERLIGRIQLHHVNPHFLSPMHASELFLNNLDAYFQRITRLYVENIIEPAFVPQATDEPAEESGRRLILAYVGAFEMYHEGLLSIDYLCRDINANFVSMRDVARGGLSWVPNDERNFIQNAKNAATRSQRLNDYLKKWGYDVEEGEDIPGRQAAIACAQASTPEHIVVPVVAMGLRRWRIDVLEKVMMQREAFDNVETYLQRLFPLKDRRVAAARLLATFNYIGTDPLDLTVQNIEDLATT